MALAAVCLAAAGCGRDAGSFAPPPQQASDWGPDPAQIGAWVRMDDPAAADYIVRDIAAEVGFQRWAYRNPELKFRVKSAEGLKFAMDFAVPEVTFRDTGPVTITVAVNGQGIGAMRCDRPGDYRFEKPVPSAAIDPERDVHLTVAAEPRWVSPQDGAQLSFLLRGAGFTR